MQKQIVRGDIEADLTDFLFRIAEFLQYGIGEFLGFLGMAGIGSKG